MRADASAGIEWTWKPQTESLKRVGFAAGGALTYPGVSSKNSVPDRDDLTFFTQVKKGGTAEASLLPLQGLEAFFIGEYMDYPSLEEVKKLSKQGNLVPVYREVVADLETPVSAFLKVADGGPCCLLESVSQGQQLARYSFIGVAPYRMLRSDPGDAEDETADLCEAGTAADVDLEVAMEIDVIEVCDDGNTDDGDGCDSNCTPTACGTAYRPPASSATTATPTARTAAPTSASWRAAATTSCRPGWASRKAR